MVLNDSEVFSIAMSTFVFGAVNMSLSTVSIPLNLFDVFCLIITQGSEWLKPPLNILLGSLIGSNIVLHVFTFVLALCEFISISLSEMFTGVAEVTMMYIMEISITSSIWLNVFYYCQVAPAQHPVFIWLKKNIRVFIYSALIMDRLLFLFGFMANLAYIIKERQKDVRVMDAMQNRTSMDFLLNTLTSDFPLRLAYISLSLCVMSASICAIVLHLWKHMQNMKEGSSSFSSPQLLSQLRSSLTGIIQAFLYLPCSAFMIAYKIITLEFPEIQLEG
uniref:Taste receptor type 2 n=1 Tax=Electrophorus electricus TaxID=8005 RepID=A0AAY5EFD0_ELEEL